MNIAVIGGNGKAGSRIAEEARGRGWRVTAVVRKKGSAPVGAAELVRDLFDLTPEDLAPFDAVVDAFGAWTPETLPLHQTSLRHLCDLLEGSEIRLYIVGGAGSLYVDEGHTIRLMDTPDFPDAFKSLAAEMGKALDDLRTRKMVHWTYLSPAADFRANGARSGRYRIGGEELLLNADGQSVISYADYAAAMVDLIEQGGHDRERVSAVAL